MSYIYIYILYSNSKIYKRGKTEYRASSVLYYNIIYDTIVDVLLRTYTRSVGGGERLVQSGGKLLRAGDGGGARPRRVVDGSAAAVVDPNTRTAAAGKAWPGDLIGREMRWWLKNGSVGRSVRFAVSAAAKGSMARRGEYYYAVTRRLQRRSSAASRKRRRHDNIISEKATFFFPII